MGKRNRSNFALMLAIVLGIVLAGSIYLWFQAEAQNKVLQQEVFALHEQVDILEKEIIALRENAQVQNPNKGNGEAGTHQAMETANQILAAIAGQDGEAWAEFVHPDQGVRFSSYGNINPEVDRVFTRDQMRTIFSDSASYNWGFYDGTGDPIVGDFALYYSEFVYDVDFLQAPEVSLNHVLGHGNTLNNLQDIYPKAVFVEYHFAGFDPQYGGMDWRSLRLVLEQKDGIWYLVGVVHDEWTT